MDTSRVELLDVHAHFVTDDYVAAASAAGHRHPDGLATWPSGSRVCNPPCTAATTLVAAALQSGGG